MAQRKIEPETPPLPSLFREEATELNDQPLKSGDPVRVLNTNGKTEKYMRGQWEFRAAVTNNVGSTWAEVYGGKKGWERLRSFDWSRIEAVPEKKHRRKINVPD